MNPPVYLVHAIGGTVLPYAALAARLGRHRRCFGLEARGVDGQEEPLDTVEAIASAHIDQIRARGEPRRWLLVGWSFGGLVAYEMAVQLSRAGAAVYPVLIDTRALLDPRRRGQAGGRVEPGTEPAGRRGATPIDDSRLVEDAAPAGDAAPSDLVVGERLRAVQAAHGHAMRRYRPGRLRGPLAFLRAAARPWAASDGVSAARLDTSPANDDVSADPALGFGRLVDGRIHVGVVPGDHDRLLAPPHVDEVAAQLASLLAAFDPVA